jgi:hypothetical protein
MNIVKYARGALITAGDAVTYFSGGRYTEIMTAKVIEVRVRVKIGSIDRLNRQAWGADPGQDRLGRQHQPHRRRGPAVCRRPAEHRADSMKLLIALTAVLSGTARKGRFRWPAHLIAATVVLVMAAITSDAGFAAVGTLLTGVALVSLGFTVAGLVDDLRVNLKDEASA